MRIRIVPNIFDKQGRQTHELLLRHPKQLELLMTDDIPECYHRGWKVSTSAQGFVDRKDWPDCTIHDADEIILMPEVQDPFTLTMILSMGGTAWLAGMGAAALALAPAALGLYSAFAAQKPGYGGDGENSPTYSWRGIENTAAPDVPVAILYGKMRLGGNYINVFVETDAIENKHYLNFLIGLCGGPVQSVAGLTVNTDNADVEAIGDKILVDGNPISNFASVNVSVRLGLDQQLAIPQFHKIHDMHTTGYELHPGDTIEYTTTGTTVENIELHILFPQGLYAVHASRGHLHPQSATLQLWYRVHGGDPTWIECTEHERTPLAGTSSPLRTSYLIYNLPGGQQYDIKIGSKPQQEDSEHVCHFQITNFDEITFDARQYPYVALLAIRLLATSQISGSLPTVTTIVEGLKVDVWDGAVMVNQYSRNPIWCTRDLIMNERHGVGRFMMLSPMDNDELKVEADYCDVFIGVTGEQDVRFRMDAVIDTVGKAFDFINQLALGFQGMIVHTRGHVKILIDRPINSSQLFAMGNIIEGSFQETFLSKREVPTKIEVQLINEDKDFERDIVEPTLVGVEAPVATDPVRTKTLWIRGVTRALQAIRIARYVFRMAHRCTRAVEFRAGIDAVACQAGQKIEFQHDVPFWGVRGGRIKSSYAGVPTKYITLHEFLEIPGGETYWIRVRTSKDEIQTKEITNAAGPYAPGDPIYVDGAWSPLPQFYDVYSIGKSGILTKPFRLLTLEQSAQNEVQLVGLEVDDEVYDETDLIDPPIQYSDLPDPRRYPKHVENLTVKNSFTYDNVVYISYTIPESTGISGEHGVIITYALFDHARIYLGRNPEKLILQGESTGTTYEIRNLVPGEEYYVKVVSVSQRGFPAPYDTAPVVSFIMQIVIPFPPVTGLELKGQGNDREFAGEDAVFTWHEYSHSTAEWLAGDEPFGAGQGIKDRAFDCYQIEIWDTLDGEKLRTEEVHDNEYAYTQEKNNNDNRLIIRGRPRALVHRGEYWARRQFVIKVRIKDKFNNLSLPAILEVTNSPPSKPTNLSAVDGLLAVMLSWSHCKDKDMKEYWVFRGEATGFLPETFLPDPNSSYLVHRGQSHAFGDKVPSPNTQYFYRVAAIDHFGPSELSVSDEVSVWVHDSDYYTRDGCGECFPPLTKRTPARFTVEFSGVRKCIDDALSEINKVWELHQLSAISPCLWGTQALIDGLLVYIYLDFRDRGGGYISQCWAVKDDSNRLFSTVLLGSCEIQRTLEANGYTKVQCGTGGQICYGGAVTWVPQDVFYYY